MEYLKKQRVMKNNNLSGEKKPEMITDKNGNQFILVNETIVAEVKVSPELAEKLNKISERLKNIPIIKASN